MIIDNLQQIPNLKGKRVFLYPIMVDSRVHRSHNKIIGFVIIDVETDQAYTISNGHQEGLLSISNLDFLNECEIYCYDIIAFIYNGYDVSNFVDCGMQYYLYTNQGYEQDSPTLIQHYTRQFQNCFKINELIPLFKHEELAQKTFKEIYIKNKQPGWEFYQKDLLDVFHNIEKRGLKVDSTLFTDRFGFSLARREDTCYTQYNYYTITGRPSNRFGGINFAALNKEDNTRECFTNKNGLLVEIDFNSYHPRLIASIIGYDFGEDNVYEHLAKSYHNTDKPTKEQITQAKEDTFRQLYGGIRKEYLHIPFFAKTNDLAQLFWEEADRKGYVESPISGRRLILSNYQDITCYTLFNYFFQMYETEHNVVLLKALFQELPKQIEPILYTYDSLLFDLPEDKLPQLQEVLKKVIPQTFPYKIKTGKSYKGLA